MREMKDSGIEWLGFLPENWGLTKISALYTLRVEKVSDKDYMPLSVTKQGVLPQLETAAKTNDGDNRKLVKKGDFAINSRSDRRGSCGISEYDGSVSLINTVLCPRGDMHPGYYNWLFHCTLFSDEFYRWGHGIVDDLWTTNWQDMKKITLPVPPLPEQHRIAAFLDRKCAEIDALTADIEAQIDTLEQYRRSVITEAVTKGLNPAAEMKDSGIEWIGEIPALWTVNRLKYILAEPMKYGAAESGIDFEESLPRYIRITDISENGKLKDEGKLSLTEVQAERYILKDKTLLFARSGATVGKTFMYEELYGRAAFAGYLISAFVDEKISFSNWLLYFSQSTVYWEWVNRAVSQATIQNIGADKYSNMQIPIAPLKEQEEVIIYLDTKCAEIDALIADKRSQLSTLANYKKSLIYEYVTGKKEVPVS